MKSYGYRGVQDLGAPDGKIHRMHDDGRVPTDNPFVGHPDAIPTIWTYGHRSPQGLEYNTAWGELWGTEMGPRGGDEVNRLLPGHNYGWPLTSKGVHYNGRPVDGRGLGIEFDVDDLEPPIVDLTPSVAVSSFVFYDGDAFGQWRNHLLVGSLKAPQSRPGVSLALHAGFAAGPATPTSHGPTAPGRLRSRSRLFHARG